MGALFVFTGRCPEVARFHELYGDKPRQYFFARDPAGRSIGVGEAADR